MVSSFPKRRRLSTTSAANAEAVAGAEVCSTTLQSSSSVAHGWSAEVHLPKYHVGCAYRHVQEVLVLRHQGPCRVLCHGVIRLFCFMHAMPRVVIQVDSSGLVRKG